MPEVRRAMRDLDPTLPVYGVQTLRKLLADQIQSPRSFGLLFASFAVVALLLASAGVYATMSFFVSQRTRELGLRVALGCGTVKGCRTHHASGRVSRRLGRNCRCCVGHRRGARTGAHVVRCERGGAARLRGCGGRSRFAASFASYGPARRASSIDPMIALRAE